MREPPATPPSPKDPVQKPLTDSEKPPAPPKPEEKPFAEFISQHLIPGLSESLSKHGIEPSKLEFIQGERPIVGGKCWMIFCELNQGRTFWLCFDSDTIKSAKTFCISEGGFAPSLLESFLIDERKITKALILSRILQRLNGQKWLGRN
ncbi:DUF2996 domain-containing protein [Prochlorococcus sp. MIT 1341]|uniref:DUF2996 domain-containing protein n=1 Tax=Prochlorococcus sp. MIT 1341 TaxID=3096221 RepID=UPI002A756AB2|nr:DUF2996 domain-containing protein [Prochlorococcus sp. MIT 1341]